MITNVVAGTTLTIALILSIFFSGFMVFVIVVSSQQARSGTTLLIIQLGSTNALLAVLFLTFSTPSILQGKWLASISDEWTEEERIDLIPSSGKNITRNQKFFKNNYFFIKETENFTTEDLYFEFRLDSDVPSQNSTRVPSEINGISLSIDAKPDSDQRREIWYGDLENLRKILTNSNLSNMIDEDVIKEGLGKYGALIDDYSVGDGLFCQIYGWFLILLHVASIWIIVGLQCDKFLAISSPLRYNTLLTRNRVAVFSVLVWIMAFTSATIPLIVARVYLYIGGACLPAWQLQDSLPYTILLALVMFLIPGCLILVINVRIVLIARRHQHRIFSAIFEVMMSAQATVTHQKNPFEVPKKSKKSTRSVVEQLLAFAVCYGPIFGMAFYEAILQTRINPKLELLFVGCLLLSPLVNSFLYGVKCKSLRKSFKNYLRRRLYKSEVKSEIEARIPSGQNSRRPSITSSIAMPFLQRTLKRRMSDHLINDPCEEEVKMVRRSSDLSWHPLEDGTPSPQRLRKPLDINLYDGLVVDHRDPRSVSQYLTVPSFEMARCYQNQQERMSLASLESDIYFEAGKENDCTEEEALTTPDGSPKNILQERNDLQVINIYPSVAKCNSVAENLPVCHNENSGRSKSISAGPLSSSLSCKSNSSTPLLISAYAKLSDNKPVNTSSPYIVQTLDALMSIGLSQSLLKFSSLWQCKSKESLKGSMESIQNTKYISVPIELIENPAMTNQSQEMATFTYEVSGNTNTSSH